MFDRRSTYWLIAVALARSAVACGSEGSSGLAGVDGGSVDAGASSGGASGGGGSDNTGGRMTSGGAPGSGGDQSSGGRGGGQNSGGQGGVPQVGPVIPPGDPGASDVLFDIRANEEVHRISPWIYGTNGAPEIARTHQTVVRSGGNRLTAYNWENNASNAGSDYQFQNDGYLSQSDSPGLVATDVVDAAASQGAAAIVTIPIVDYVSADKNGGGDVRNSGADYLSTRFRKNVAEKGSAFSNPPDPNDDSVYEDEFVSFLKAARPNATIFFSMDNEPDLWSETHAEVHPDPVTYSELWDRNERFSKAVKAVWPGAAILGFVSYGFNGYVTLQNAPDANGRNFVEWYLDQAKTAEGSAGERLIDYLDLHWYPEAQGGGQRITSGGNDQAVADAREQAPRSLWDAAYREQSWIADYQGGPIDLLHWLKTKVDAHYPGTLVSFSEWNYGGGDDVSGALAVADVLGIYGKEAVGLATYWPLKSDETFAYAAFRAYRNYDGNGARFGDTSVAATSSDVPTATVYASIDSADPNHTVIVALNKARTSKTAGIKIAHSVAYGTAQVWTLTSSGANVAAGASLQATATNAFSYTMPAQSVSVIVPSP